MEDCLKNEKPHGGFVKRKLIEIFFEVGKQILPQFHPGFGTRGVHNDDRTRCKQSFSITFLGCRRRADGDGAVTTVRSPMVRSRERIRGECDARLLKKKKRKTYLPCTGRRPSRVGLERDVRTRDDDDIDDDE